MRVSTCLFAVALGAAALLLPRGAVRASGSDWARRLGSNDATEVYKTVLEIRDHQDISAGLALIETALTTDCPHIAIACGEALAHMKPDEVGPKLLHTRDFAKRWRRILREKDLHQQINLARLLGAWGNPFVDGPLAHLASGRRKPEVQAEALFMCGDLVATDKQKFPQTAEAIGKALKGRSDDIRAAACSAAGRRKLAQFSEQIASVVHTSRDAYAGLYGVWALKQIGWHDGIDSFVHVATHSPKRETLQANLKAVTELAQPSDVEDLLALSRHPSKDLRDAAVLALGRLAWRATRKRDLAQEAKKDDAAAAAPTTGEPKKAAPDPKPVPGPHLTPLPTPPMVVPDKVIERLLKIVMSDREDWEVRDAARQSLVRFGTLAQPLVQQELPLAVTSSVDDVRFTAMELCGLFHCKAAYGELLKAAVYDKDPTARMFAARALEGVDPDRAVKDLTKDLKPRKSPRSSELAAVRALGYIRTMPSYSYLVGMFVKRDFSEAMEREAEFALERLTGHRFGRKPDRWTHWMSTARHPFHPRVSEFDRKKNRREAREKKLYGLSPVTERSVEAGLRWLERQQHAVGCWDGNDKGFGGVIGCQPAYTGLAALAYLGAGYSGAAGKYHETIRRASEFLAATQFYDGSFPVTGGGDSSWIFAYSIAMGVWGIIESYGLSEDERLAEPAQWGLDYLGRVQTPGAGWRYGPRYTASDTSCTSWVLMTTKMADLLGLYVAQRSWDGIDSWLERCASDITGQEEVPADLSSDYDYEVGHRRYYKAFTGYFELSGKEKSAAQMTSMTAVGMVCRFFMGWNRSHPFLIGSANYLKDYLPQWMQGLNKGQAIAWYHYFWYYGTLAMYQMGGRYWRAWNERIKKMYPEHQCLSPPSLAGSWDPDTAKLNGGRLFSTSISILTLETYYRFSPHLAAQDESGK